MLQRTQPPAIHEATDFVYTLPSIETQTLKNKIPLYIVNAGVQPVCQLELVFDAGSWHETKNGIASTAMAMLKNGTSKKSSLVINEMLEQYGIHFKANAGADWSVITISCLSKNIQYALPLLLEILEDAQFPKEELDIFINNQKQKLSINLKKSDFIANRLIDEYYFGLQHPYGKYMTVETYDAIEVADLIQYKKSFLSHNNCQVFLSGKLSSAEIELVANTLGNTPWNATATVATKKIELQSAVQKKYRVAHQENSVQGSVRMLRSFPEKTHPDFSPMIVANTLFGGYFGSRLMSNIREDKGYTYGIYSYLMNNKYSGGFVISTEAGKEVCENVLEEVYKEMELLKNEKVSKEELQLVKNYLLGSILGDLDGAFHIMQRWKNIILNNFTEERFYTNIEIYKTITPQKIQELANTYFHKDNFYELVVA